MSNPISFSFLSFLLALSLSAPLSAEETALEKNKKQSNSSVRAIKKGMNRVGEALCVGSEIKCSAGKAGNRVTEAKDSVIDGAKAAKEKLD